MFRDNRDADDLPQYQMAEKQEAVRYLARDLDPEPLISGMKSVKRVDAWLKVIERFDPGTSSMDVKGVRKELQERRQMLVNAEDVSYQPASELDAEPIEQSEAVADGGAEVVDGEEEPAGDGQEVMEYGDAAERESEYREARNVAKMYESAAEVKEKLQQEFERDVRRPHVVDALEERLQEVANK